MTRSALRRRPTPRGWAVPRRRRAQPRAATAAPRTAGRHRGPRPLLLAVVLAVLLAACSGGPSTVAGVTVEVPSGWQETTAPTPATEVAAAASWQGGQDDASTLQVVVGCGPGSVQDLATAAITEPRPPLEVTAAEEVGEVDVPGADAALELRFTLGAGRDDDATSLRVAGVYAEVEESLVLVEVSTPVRDTARELVDTTLGSVELDAEEVASYCG